MDRNNHTFFSNTACRYFPCHGGAEPKDFNCLFCYCPLYALGDGCGGNFSYTGSGVKDCSACLLPHTAGGYERVLEGCQKLVESLRKQPHGLGGEHP